MKEDILQINITDRVNVSDVFESIKKWIRGEAEKVTKIIDNVLFVFFTNLDWKPVLARTDPDSLNLIYQNRRLLYYKQPFILRNEYI